MAAIAYPSRQTPADRPALRLVQGGVGHPRPHRLPQPHRLASRRVYWRRRVVALLLAAGLLFTLRAVPSWLGSGPLSAPEPPATAIVPIANTQYVVQPGDTVWAIARKLHPTGDVRPSVDQLQAQVPGGVLVPGTRLNLP